MQEVWDAGDCVSEPLQVLWTQTAGPASVATASEHWLGRGREGSKGCFQSIIASGSWAHTPWCWPRPRHRLGQSPARGWGESSFFSVLLLSSHWLCRPRRGSLCPTVSSAEEWGGGQGTQGHATLPSCPVCPGPQPDRCPNSAHRQEKGPLCTKSMTAVIVMNVFLK